MYLGAPSITISNSYFGGLIDEPAIYNRALTSAEVLAIRQAGAAGRCKVKPLILTQPISQRVQVGSNVTFSVEATGTPLLRYQWLRSGQGIFGATSSSYSFIVQGFLTISVRVSNIFGTVTSSNALLIPNRAPILRKVTAIPQFCIVMISSNQWVLANRRQPCTHLI